MEPYRRPKIGVRVALTGRPGCGKTTLIRKVVEALQGQGRLATGGIYTEEIREGGVRKGFAIIDIATGRRGLLAHTDLPSGPKVGKYRVNLKDIEGLAVPAIEEALKTKELLVIDEIAPMEFASPEFIEAVEAALKSERHLLFAVQQRLAHPLALRIRREFSIFDVTSSNRDGLFRRLMSLFA
ncbi:MAG: NTPase [Candidatus Bipolaricaulia bacterium]